MAYKSQTFSLPQPEKVPALDSGHVVARTVIIDDGEHFFSWRTLAGELVRSMKAPIPEQTGEHVFRRVHLDQPYTLNIIHEFDHLTKNNGVL